MGGKEGERKSLRCKCVGHYLAYTRAFDIYNWTMSHTRTQAITHTTLRSRALGEAEETSLLPINQGLAILDRITLFSAPRH
jgi:hypothetical protein